MTSPQDTPVTQPLRDEHRELMPQVESLQSLADAVTPQSPSTVANAVDQASSFLDGHLLIHAQAEEQVLYPVVAKAMGAPMATATMRRDHVEVARFADALRGLRAGLPGAETSEETARRVRRLLYGLYALLKVHFAKEEEVYLPLLDAQLTPQGAKKLFEAMEAAAGEARRNARGR